jgi:hypothetical protein
VFCPLLSCSPEAIVRDFQNQTLQQEWDKFRTSVLIRRNERAKALNEAQVAQKQQREVQAALLAQRKASLDQAIDEMNAKFSDEAIALEYDASKLLQKFQAPAILTVVYDDIDKDSRPLPCLGQRAHWMDCQKKYAADSRPCNAYVEALEQCVKDTISKVASASG